VQHDRSLGLCEAAQQPLLQVGGHRVATHAAEQHDDARRLAAQRLRALLASLACHVTHHVTRAEECEAQRQRSRVAVVAPAVGAGVAQQRAEEHDRQELAALEKHL